MAYNVGPASFALFAVTSQVSSREDPRSFPDYCEPRAKPLAPTGLSRKAWITLGPLKAKVTAESWLFLAASKDASTAARTSASDLGSPPKFAMRVQGLMRLEDV